MPSSRKLQRKRLHRAQKRRKRGNRQGHILQQPGVRMSEVIRHLAKPIFDKSGDTPEDIERIITLAIAAWNLTLLSSEIRAKQFDKLSRKLCGRDSDSVAMFRWICDVVAERKLRYYPHLNNAIVDVHFTRESADTVYFEVAYALAPNTPR